MTVAELMGSGDRVLAADMFRAFSYGYGLGGQGICIPPPALCEIVLIILSRLNALTCEECCIMCSDL